MASATDFETPAEAMTLRFTPNASALARVLPVATTLASSVKMTVPPSTCAETFGAALASASEPLTARPRPAAAATL